VLAVLSLGLSAGIHWFRRAPDEAGRMTAAGVSAGLAALLVVSATAPWVTHYVGAAWTGLILGTCESQRLALPAAREAEGSQEAETMRRPA
jgi:hypothetical protein